MRRARQEFGDEMPPPIDSTEPEVRFAAGTREMDLLSIELVEEEPASNAFATASQAVFVIGADGSIEDANAVAETIVGYTRAELLGQRVMFGPSHSTMSSHHVRSFAGRVRHRTGREVAVDILLCPHDEGSSIAFITPHVAREPRRHQSSEVVHIVHDLKNPLATIALEMCILEDKLGQSELRPAVTRVTQNVAFLDRMVHDLLDASAIDADSFQIHRLDAELRALLERVLERTTATRDRSRVYLDAPRAVPILIDDLRIERVVANLLQNAFKYSPSSSAVVVRLETRKAVARVSVTDTGPGITPSETPYIFDKYRRASSAIGHDGNGLGLYVSKRIVEAHGGTIGVESVPGVGSCFFFELPLAG